jgi:hypothetical protein
MLRRSWENGWKRTRLTVSVILTNFVFQLFHRIEAVASLG